jgi:prepilin-type N-terminal cleavage/methylation domain-containing protein
MNLTHQLHSHRATQSGLSLVELLVSVAVASIVFAAVGSLSLFTTRSFVAMGNYNDLDRVSRNALDTMSREIRQAKQLTGYTSNKLTFQNQDNSTVVFEYSPGTGKLTRQKGTTTTTLLTQCDLLSFNISQRNPSNNFSFFPVTGANLATAKLIDVNWRCSRQILGKKVNTESVQTAKIVLRN